jgi:hypothetical protein
MYDQPSPSYRMNTWQLWFHPAFGSRCDPPRWTAPELWTCPCVATRGAPQRGKSRALTKLPSHGYPYHARNYCLALAKLNPALVPLSGRWCVWKSQWQVDPLTFRLGQAHVLHEYKKNPKKCTPKTIKVGRHREVYPHLRSQISCFELTPAKVPKIKRLLLLFFPHTRQEHVSPIQTHASWSSAYIHTYIV